MAGERPWHGGCGPQGALPGFTFGAPDGEVSVTLRGSTCDGRGDIRPVRGGRARHQSRIAWERHGERAALSDPALDRDPAAVHLDDGPDDRETQAAAAAARLVGARPAVEPLEDVRAARPGRSRCRCRSPRSGRPRRCAARSTVTEPPGGVNLMALPMRLPTTWPMRWRIVADPDGRVGQVRRERDAALRAAAACCSTADSTDARRSSGRRSSRTRPESSFESSSRFWASQSSRSICWPLESRNSARASGSDPGPLLEQLVERAQRRQRRPQLVRDVGEEVAAAVAIAADDLDALLDPVGHRVERDGQLGHLRRSRPRTSELGTRSSGRRRPSRGTPRSVDGAAS